MATKQFYHDIDLVKVGQLVNARIQNVTTAEKTALGETLGSGNVGLQVWDTDIAAPFIWDGSAWVRDALVVTGDVVFKGVINPTNASSVEKVNGYQYVVDTAGDISTAGVTFSPSAVVEVGDVVLFTSATEASVFQRNTELATETSQGIVELATQAEVDAGVDTSRVITPATLAGSQLASDVSTLQSNLATEIANRIAGDSALEGSLASEVARATAAEGVLQSNIDAEAAARVAGDSDLTASLAVEVARAQAAESALQSNLDSDKAAIEASLAAEIARAQAAEAGLDSDISALQQAVNTNISSQIAAIEVAHDSDVASINSAIAAEIARATAAEGVLQSNLDSDKAAIEASLASEVSRATAAEGVLQSNIDSDKAAIEASLAAETAARVAGDSDLTASLATEVARATAAEGVLQSNLDSDVANLQGQISGNDSDIAVLQAGVTTLEAATQIKAYSNDDVSITGGTPLTVEHNLGLFNKDFFTIRVADSASSDISVDVDAVDANSITLTSAVSLTGVKVFLMGV
jgi:ribosomal protein S25